MGGVLANWMFREAELNGVHQPIGVSLLRSFLKELRAKRF